MRRTPDIDGEGMGAVGLYLLRQVGELALLAVAVSLLAYAMFH